jgi:hypothetical protein
MPVETRAQLTARYLDVVEAAPLGTGLLADEDRDLGVAEPATEGTLLQQRGWWEEEASVMASGVGTEGRQRFSGKKGDGLTHKQFQLMVKGSLADRFKKLQKDVGNPVEGAEFKQKYCIYLGEFLDNPAKLAHEREYETHNQKADPVGALLASLKRHFEDHKEGKAQEWVAFRREPGEELPTMLFRLQGLALNLEKSLSDQELVVKFITALDRRLGEQTSSQAMSSTLQAGGAYTLDEAYEAALMVSAANSRLRIARELLPRAVGTEQARSRWGPRALEGTHAAVAGRTLMAAAAAPSGWQGVPGSCHNCTGGLQSPMAAVAAPPGGPGGSGACHNCGEVGHYKNGCPYPRRNRSGRVQGGGGGRGGGRAPMACFVCGDLSHVASQCAKRVVPVAAAAALDAAKGEMHSVGLADFQAFEEWRSMSAAVATEAEGSEEDDGWDDQDYALGAVALPLGQAAPLLLVQVAAAGTRAGAEKAKATRAAAKGKTPAAGKDQGKKVARQTGPGTASIARPVDPVAIGILKSRRDKAAAKERVARLPDHGRQVAPQGLNRLPAGFPIGTPGGHMPVVLADRVQVPLAPLGPIAGAGTQRRPSVLTPLSGPQPQAPVGGCSPQVGRGEEPALAGTVQVQVGVFLKLALRAGMDLAAVVALTGPREHAGCSQQQETATLAALERVAPRALVQQAGAMMGLSPVARRAQAASGPVASWGGTATEQVAVAGVRGTSPVIPLPAEQPDPGVVQGGTHGKPHQSQGQVEGRVQPPGMDGSRLGRASSPTYRSAVAHNSAPESSAMGAARGAPRANEAGDREVAQEVERKQQAAQESHVTATSRDAELAMLLVAADAREQGVDRDVALRAQGGAPSSPPQPVGREGGTVKGKEIAQTTDQNEAERALSWERQLNAGAWRGAADLAPVTPQPNAAMVASRAHTHALACFADGRPLVSTTDRVGFEGTPDWVDNSHRAVQVMSSHGLVAPARVLLDGGSFYSMAGASLRLQLGLTAADMDEGRHKVHTATGKVESLPGGLTKNPIPIVLNKGEPSEVTLYERLAFTDSRGYDLLLGTRAAYPCGLSVDRWAKRAVYRADWLGKGEVVGHLPMKLHQERQGAGQRLGPRTVGARSRRELPWPAV